VTPKVEKRAAPPSVPPKGKEKRGKVTPKIEKRAAPPSVPPKGKEKKGKVAPKAPPEPFKAPESKGSKQAQVRHDALLAGGGFSLIGGTLMLLSLLLPWVDMQGEPLGLWDLLQEDLIYLSSSLVPFLGASMMVLAVLTMLKALSKKGRGRGSMILSILAMSSSLLVILAILLLQRDFEGQGALYGAGAFLVVIGAIFVMSGSLLLQVMTGKVAQRDTGFQALARRSMRPSENNEWKPPESSVQPPRCPSCGEELQPGWLACPNCGHTLIEERDDKRL
jgi:hypothetical protein